MKKLLFVLAFVSVLFQSCAVSPVPDADDPRTLYLVQVSMTYGNEGAGNYIAETVNRSAISSAIESLFYDGHTDFDEMEAVIFDEVRGSYYLSASAEVPEESACMTCHQSREAVKAKTAKLKPNPHFGHDETVECTACHKEHQQSVLICDECHQWGYKTP